MPNSVQLNKTICTILKTPSDELNLTLEQYEEINSKNVSLILRSLVNDKLSGLNIFELKKK
jgi:hypothetical protein